MALFTETLDVINYVESLLDTNMVGIGLKGVYVGMERMTANMPAAIIDPQEKETIRHTTNQGFRHDFHLMIYIMHAKLTVASQGRTKEELQLVTATVGVINQSKTLMGNIVDGYCRREQYGSVVVPKLGYVKGTRIVWEGFSIV